MGSTVPLPASTIDFRLLGSLHVDVDGVAVPVGGPRQMAVLARLMLTPDQVVSMDQLVESVWDGDEPSQPHTAIRSYVSNLRRAIEPNRRRRASDSLIASVPPGYRLAIDPASVDWVRFERLVNEGREKLQTGDYTGAIERLRTANGLWKGDPCSGLPESQIFLGHRGRMTKLRETAVELLFEGSLRLGDHAFVVSQVEAAIDEHPLHERLTELAMMAFYQAGRQSEALALGRRLRERLRDDLGIDPGPAIDEMELKILNHDPSIGPTKAPTVRVGPPPLPAPAPQTPTETEAEDPAVQHATTDMFAACDPALRRLDGTFAPVGRERELGTLARIGQMLDAGRSMTVALTGDQGIGKTTLACTTAASLASDHGAHVVWSRGVPGENAPLWPWSQLVLGLLERPNDEAPVVITPDLLPLRALGSCVAGVLGLATPSGEKAAEEYTRVEVMMAVTRLLELLARRSPLLLVFEDLQWSDAATVKLLNYAASTLVSVPVAFILTWRETDINLGADDPGLRELVRLPRMLRLELDGLDTPAIAKLATITGHSLSDEDCAQIQARCGGNPLFVNEVLGHSSLQVNDGRRWSTLVDAVQDRIDQVDSVALPLLSAAALFRTPFTLDGLAEAAGLDAAAAQALLNLCVRGGILIEADPAAGSYRFRHPLIAEVLASELLAVERSAKHQTIGTYLLATAGPRREVAFHLSHSPVAEERVLAARIALELLHSDFEPLELTQTDQVVSIGMAAAELLNEEPGDALRDAFLIDALHYESWRAWVDGRPAEWLENGTEALSRALRALPEGGAKNQARSKVSSMAATLHVAGARLATEPTGPEGARERLHRCAMNLLGQPTPSVGPTNTITFADVPTVQLEELSRLADNLGGDDWLKWIVQLHTGYLELLTKDGTNSRTKAVKDAQKVVSNARRRLSPALAATVQMSMLSRFGEFLDPAARLESLSELTAMQPGATTELFRARHGYPALLELGRTYDAELLVLQACDAASSNGSPFLTAESRLLRIRHLLWTGQLQAADEELDVAIADWTDLGLAEPVPFIRQRRTVRLLNGQQAGRGHGPDSHHQLLVERTRTPELALRLARIGDDKRAIECLELSMAEIGMHRVSLSDLALLTMAACRLEHDKAALATYELLAAAGDTPVVRADGSAILGPASLYAGLAAGCAGLDDDVPGHLDKARRALQRFGGSPASMDAVLTDVGHRSRSNSVPIDS